MSGNTDLKIASGLFLSMSAYAFWMFWEDHNVGLLAYALATLGVGMALIDIKGDKR